MGKLKTLYLVVVEDVVVIFAAALCAFQPADHEHRNT